MIYGQRDCQYSINLHCLVKYDSMSEQFDIRRERSKSEFGSFSSHYWSGFFDLALSFQIQKHIDTSHKRARIGTFYNPEVAVYSTRRQAIDLVKNNFTLGNIHGSPELWSWTIQKSEDIYNFLELVEPYLILQKDQCRLMLDFLYEKIQRKQLPRGSISPEDREESEDIYYEELLGLRKTGYTSIYQPAVETLAGMLDIAGGINIYKKKDRDQYDLEVTLASQHPGLIEGIYTKYGGTVGTDPRRISIVTPNIWQAWEGTALQVLQDIQPHSLLRKSMVDLGIEFQRKELELEADRNRTRSKDSAGYHFIPDPNTDARNKTRLNYYLRMRELRRQLGEVDNSK